MLLIVTDAKKTFEFFYSSYQYMSCYQEISNFIHLL